MVWNPNRRAWPTLSLNSQAPPAVKPEERSHCLAGAPRLQELRSEIWGKFQGDRGSRSRDVSGVARVEVSSRSFLVQIGKWCSALKGGRGLGPAAA